MAGSSRKSTSIAKTSNMPIAPSLLDDEEKSVGFGPSGSEDYARTEVISVDKYNIQKAPIGSLFRGTFLFARDGEPFEQLNKETKKLEMKTLTFLYFRYLPGDTAGMGRWRVIQDKGLIQCLQDGNIQAGDEQPIEIEKLGKIKLSGGRDMNQYRLYTLGKVIDAESE